MKEPWGMMVKDGRELLMTVKDILEKEFTVMRVPINGFHVSRYVRRLPGGVDIEVSIFAPAAQGETTMEDCNCLRIKKPISRRELALAIKEILGRN